ncbi:Troponin I [Eumeta japonica]|uniref:Troponin I n=1 Tax=Eumeta variegata TaxID=151549 RepID=A0A4C1X5L5_EUMVA|nr:Troponin I [Eumeta japonica]
MDLHPAAVNSRRLLVLQRVCSSSISVMTPRDSVTQINTNIVFYTNCCHQAKKAKQAEIDRKRAEVRKRMEEASKAKKAKKGFMTPERKKKLRLLLRKKAAEELKKEQERKAAERRRIIEERCGKPKNIDDANEDTIKRVCKEYHDRIAQLEDQKYDLEYVVKRKDAECTAIAGAPAQVGTLRRAAALTSIITGYHQRITKLEEEKYDREMEVARKELEEYYDRMYICEGQKWDLEHEVRKRDYEWGDARSGRGRDRSAVELYIVSCGSARCGANAAPPRPDKPSGAKSIRASVASSDMELGALTR